MKIAEWFDNLPLPGPVKDIIFVVVVVGGISLLSQLILGLWTPMVAVESGSMVPNLNIGDIVVVQGASRTDIIPWDEAEATGYMAFNNPGDVILYRPYGKASLNLLDQLKMLLGWGPGNEKATPIIHRALRYVDEGEPMWEGGPLAPFSGYITKGDHNAVIDQMAGQIFAAANLSYVQSHRGEIMDVGSGIFLDKNTGLLIYSTENGTFVGEGISYLTPVKKEWVIGKAWARIPLVGYIRLLPNMLFDEIKKLVT
ncbi:MAG TPA: S26 family signal peptidase [Methanothrix sp.]|nr:S26 family signal peptidase [Methanothrix sp.]HPT18671.1 S26 family signal peptidase [Methanothrix sp.]